jgi:ubiquinone/menaquinone biosynthesis C-methylase UbiE
MDGRVVTAMRIDEQRRTWQDPDRILSGIGVTRGDVFVDVGCGDGFFAIPAALRVGERGAVYGVDINRDAVRRLRDEAARVGVTKLIATTGRAEDTVFCVACADIVFFGIDLHDFQDPNQVLRNAWRMLKPGGRVVDLDWKKEPMTLGPPLRIRFSEEDATRLIAEAGFTVESVKAIGRYHYMVTATRPHDP